MSDTRRPRTSILFIGLVLVVVVILSAALYPPHVGPVKNDRRATARIDEIQIVMAVKAYFAEYGKYPADVDRVYSADNNLLFDVLLNKTGSKEGNALNPKGIVFLTISPAKDQARPTAGLQSSTGIWFDPWGTPYNVAIDGDQDGEFNGKAPISGFYSDVGLLKSGVIVWALGKNGELGGGAAVKRPDLPKENGEAGKLMGSSDVVSWK